jgi:hypothetical protein
MKQWEKLVQTVEDVIEKLRYESPVEKIDFPGNRSKISLPLEPDAVMD